MADEGGGVENAELLLFRAKECYVYTIPPRKSAASYRADEWNVNKWTWEGSLRVVSKGEECTVRLEDSKTGDLFAQAPVTCNQPLPFEPVIDSSRYFVLRIEDTSTVPARHAFIGIGFRERTEAYDFQAALHDHIKYLNKKKQAEEIEQEYQLKPSVDYSLKQGETLRLQLKTGRGDAGKSQFFEQNIDTKNLQPPTSNSAPVPVLPPPPPPADQKTKQNEAGFDDHKTLEVEAGFDDQKPLKVEGGFDDDFGEFQAADSDQV